MAGLRVLATGMSGPVGAGLLPVLSAAGHRVTRLARHAATGESEIQWDPATPLSPETVSGFDVVIHLAGESIFGRWTEAKKQRILLSRTLGTRNLSLALANASSRPRVLISGSAIGYYGDRGDETLTEDSSPGSAFLTKVCQQWEAATQPAASAGIRVVSLRLGVVLSPQGGALGQMLLPFKMGVGGRLGSGRQYMSWVSIKDVVGAIEHALSSDSLHGPTNVVSPNPVNNAEFTQALAQVLHRPAIFPMPRFVVRTLFGEMGDELLLSSARVLPKQLQATGYRFRHPELTHALRDLLGK